MNEAVATLILECFNEECRKPHTFDLDVRDQKRVRKEYEDEGRNDSGGQEWTAAFERDQESGVLVPVDAKAWVCPGCGSNQHSKVWNY